MFPEQNLFGASVEMLDSMKCKHDAIVVILIVLIFN